MLISFNKLSVPSDVELVARNTMINLASFYTSHRWFLTSRFLNTSVMVQTDLVPTISLQYSLIAFAAAHETEFRQNHSHIMGQHHCIHYRGRFLLQLWEGDFLILCMFWWIFQIESIFDGIDDTIQLLVVYFSVMRYTSSSNSGAALFPGIPRF